MKKSTKVMFKEVTIEEFYKKIGKDVFWFWRFDGEKQWRKELTPYHDIPVIYFHPKQILNPPRH